jgi:putative restriction endonuclease
LDLIHDARVRAAAFTWLREQVSRLSTDVLPYPLLLEGFQFEGLRVPLLGPQGIFKPKVLEGAPLSITTSPSSPYDDGFGPDGLLRYRYRGTDPRHPDNEGLRTAMRLRLPLVYLHGVAVGRYLAAWPVYVAKDDPSNLAVSVAVDDVSAIATTLQPASEAADDVTAARRSYITSIVRARLHQRSFRERVLEAYRNQCAFCRLRHEELLSAAHIVPDSHPQGEPIVSNGLALCALHHCAFDRLFIGLRPDYVIEIREDILHESDGPTLAHAIQGLHGQTIAVPRVVAHRPDPALLEIRYKEFKKAS